MDRLDGDLPRFKTVVPGPRSVEASSMLRQREAVGNRISQGSRTCPFLATRLRVAL